MTSGDAFRATASDPQIGTGGRDHANPGEVKGRSLYGQYVAQGLVACHEREHGIQRSS